MNTSNFVAVIPARYASSRFPGKPLAIIGGKMMIERVWLQVKKVIDHVYIATDDVRIADAVKSFGGEVIMTSPEHKSGTDRINEAVKYIHKDIDVVINIQGDEPFIDPHQIEEIMRCFSDKDTKIATLVRKFDKSQGVEALVNPNTPKVVIDKNMNACYFSRAVLPYVRGRELADAINDIEFYTHIGIYAYRKDVLREITALEQSPLELAESLEQLRWIENGYKIKVGISNSTTIGIDTPEDLKHAEEYLKKLNQHA